MVGIYAPHKTLKYFPQGLHKFFKNLKLIFIQSCQLGEIHQSDLKYFTDLVYFELVFNGIEVIEEGLFDFNPNLELVRFYESKIIHIDPNVFDHLDKLRTFWFYYVPCIKQDIYDSKEGVKDAIKIVKSKCVNSDFLELDEKIKNLQTQSRTLTFEVFSEKLASFEKVLKNSKLSKFRSLKRKFEDLKITSSCPNCDQLIESTKV